MCVITTVADAYDVDVTYLDASISLFPCFACMHIRHGPLSYAHIRVVNLNRVVYAGVSSPFQIWLHDEYDNVIAPSKGFVFTFKPDPWHYIRENQDGAGCRCA